MKDVNPCLIFCNEVPKFQSVFLQNDRLYGLLMDKQTILLYYFKGDLKGAQTLLVK